MWISLAYYPGKRMRQEITTLQYLLKSLNIWSSAVTLAEAIEFNRIEARSAAGKGCEELPVAV